MLALALRQMATVRLVNVDPSRCTVGSQLVRPRAGGSPVHLFGHRYGDTVGPCVEIEGRLAADPRVSAFDQTLYDIEIIDAREELVLETWHRRFRREFETTAKAQKWAMCDPRRMRPWLRGANPIGYRRDVMPTDMIDEKTLAPIERWAPQLRVTLWTHNAGSHGIFRDEKVLVTKSMDENDRPMCPTSGLRRGNKVRVVINMSRGYCILRCGAPAEVGLTLKIALLKRLDSATPTVNPLAVRWAPDDDDDDRDNRPNTHRSRSMSDDEDADHPIASRPQIPENMHALATSPRPGMRLVLSNSDAGPAVGDAKVSNSDAGRAVGDAKVSNNDVGLAVAKVSNSDAGRAVGDAKVANGVCSVSHVKMARFGLNDGAMVLAAQEADAHEIFHIRGVIDLIVGYASASLPLFATVPTTGALEFVSCFNALWPRQRVDAVVAVRPKLPTTDTTEWAGLIVPMNALAAPRSPDRTVFESASREVDLDAPPPPQGQYVVHYVNLRAPPQIFVDRTYMRPGVTAAVARANPHLRMDDKCFTHSAAAYGDVQRRRPRHADLLHAVFHLPAEVDAQHLEVLLQLHTSQH